MREVEDIEAIIQVVGGAAFLFGSSSGAVLALDAASQLGGKVRGTVLYEPPLIVDASRAPVPDDLMWRIQQLLSAGRRNDATKLLFARGMGIPGWIVTLMRLLMPGWSKMAGMAHTIPYDLAILDGVQNGNPLPADRWASHRSPALVLVGSKSERFFHNGAMALVAALPNARYEALEGGNHGTMVMAPKRLAAAVSRFLVGRDAGPDLDDRETPRLCRGDSQSLTAPGVS
jgi:pimeloyl-ACP methyl ester carboxylesterase